MKLAGYVYFIKPCFKDGPIKIGYTTGDLDYRLSNIQGAHYEDLEVMAVVESDNAKALERSIHERFSEIWIRGEWYCGHLSLYQFIDKLPGVKVPAGEWKKGRSGWQWATSEMRSDCTMTYKAPIARRH